MAVYSSVAVLALGFAAVQLVQSDGFATLDILRSRTPPSVQTRAVQDLVKRLVGDKSSFFLLTVDPSIGPSGKDTFKLRTASNQIGITGTSGVAVAMGFYYYLKYYAGGQVTWAGKQVHLPDVPPPVPSPGVTVTSNDRFRYYQNVCTVSYSMAWWDWSRWEREIDWMALQGINLPLAFTGQEAIFQRVYLAMGFTNEDLGAHFGGPAFLAWARMGNIRGFGGPLPRAWIDGRLALQHKILDRMRSLGITPVLPAFAGHVPAAITRLFPHANVTRLGPWAGFNYNNSATYLLDFEDPLFTTIGRNVIKTMEKEFNVDHIYNADSFNEMTPRSSDPSYLASAARGVFNGMVAGDPQAIWLMQGWLFHASFWKQPQIKALLTAIPKGKMVILDLNADSSNIYSSTESFYGQPFIWCMLHNFGGLNEMYGDLTTINGRPMDGRNFPNSTMVGTGLTPEGINQNEVMYELMNEQAWRNGSTDLAKWIDQYQKQRYGGGSTQTSTAWSYLTQSVYKSGSTSVVLIHRPSLGMSEHFNYDPEVLYKAWDNMVLAGHSLSNMTLFRYDLVDVSKASLHHLALPMYEEIIHAYNTSNAQALRTAGNHLLELIDDVDTLLASDEHFLLGRWSRDAARFATNDAEKILYDFNARNQLTLWGREGEISDYACKMWSGLVRSYYKPRWELFINTLLNCVINKKPFDASTFDQSLFTKVESPFSSDQTNFSNTTTGDSISIAAALHKKYRLLTSKTSDAFVIADHLHSGKTVLGPSL